ncbi:MAG: hypothetical protein AB1411_10760 [Nitrospirota bacterium]
MKWFKRFFGGVSWFKSLTSRSTGDLSGLWIYLRKSSQKCFQNEIDKWVKVAIKRGKEQTYQRRLEIPLKKLNLYHVKSVLNELMVAHFFESECGFHIDELEPLGHATKRGDLLIRSPQGTQIFLEVKSPWEPKRQGGAFSSYARIRQAIEEGYLKLPKRQIPTLILLADELNVSLTSFDRELIQVLYGKTAIVYSVDLMTGRGHNPRHAIVDRRGVFQRTQRTSLGAVAVLKHIVYPVIRKHNRNFIQEDISKYIFRIYHNPFAHPDSQIPSHDFPAVAQFTLNKQNSYMEWIYQD